MNKGTKIAMGIGIAIVIALFAGFGAQYVGDYFLDNCTKTDGYCNTNYKIVPNNEQCSILTNQVLCSANVNCEWFPAVSLACQHSFENAFAIFATIIGVLALASGFFVKDNNALAGGLVGGGIISLIIAVVSYWNNLNDLFRVSLIGVLALILIVIAYMKLKD